MARQGEFARMADVLIPFFVTRQIFCGAGKVLHGPRGAVYCISQRAEHIWEGVSSATTRSRPIINTRDEPHADAERFRRLHVIVGDSNMSEFTTFLKVAVTDLVVRMVEENTVMRDLSLENPIRAIREICHDVTCKRKVRLATGRELTAIEIQREYFDPRCASSSGGAPTRPRARAQEWGLALDALESGDLDGLDRSRLGREAAPDRALPREARPAARPPAVALMDLAYHEVNRDRGLYYLLERRGAMERVVERQGHPTGDARAAADHPRAAARRVHPPGEG